MRGRVLPNRDLALHFHDPRPVALREEGRIEEALATENERETCRDHLAHGASVTETAWPYELPAPSGMPRFASPCVAFQMAHVRREVTFDLTRNSPLAALN